MIRITEDININENDLKEEFIRSSGPGGQNVNKVSTAVQLRFNVANSNLPSEVKERLVRLAGKKMAGTETLIISARRFRSQEKNRKDAYDRLLALIRKSIEKPLQRKKTKPNSISIEKRLKEKHIKSELKKQRSSEW